MHVFDTIIFICTAEDSLLSSDALMASRLKLSVPSELILILQSKMEYTTIVIQCAVALSNESL